MKLDEEIYIYRERGYVRGSELVNSVLLPARVMSTRKLREKTRKFWRVIDAYMQRDRNRIQG